MNKLTRQKSLQRALTSNLTYLAISFGMISAVQAESYTLDFDSLPSAQGWTYLPGPLAEDDAFLANGSSLVQTTVGSGENSFARYQIDNVVESSKRMTLSFTARILDYERLASGSTGLGFNFLFGDAGSSFRLAMTDDALQVGGQSILFDTTTFHDYVFDTQPGGSFELFVDGTLITSGNDSGSRSTNFLFFGDSTSHENTNAEITAFSFAVEVEEFGGVAFPSGAASFADRVFGYDPTYGGGPAPDETQQDARQLLGVPGQGEMSLGEGGRVRLQFLDNSLTGSDDDRPDLYIFEVGGEEATHIDISKDGRRWFPVGMAAGFASGIDIDAFGFDSDDRFSYVRITDDGDGSGDFFLTPGADLVAVGARSSAPPVKRQPPINYHIQAHIGGRSELIIQGSRLQWHHVKGTAPGLERAFWNYGSNSNSPTIIDSNQGPNIPWVPTGWPGVIGNGTHPESMSSVFDALTPVFPRDGRCWKLDKIFGSGKTRIIQQPNAGNDYTMVIEFDDMILGKRGGLYNLPGSGFYSIKLSQTYKRC